MCTINIAIVISVVIIFTFSVRICDALVDQNLQNANSTTFVPVKKSTETDNKTIIAVENTKDDFNHLEYANLPNGKCSVVILKIAQYS